MDSLALQKCLYSLQTNLSCWAGHRKHEKKQPDAAHRLSIWHPRKKGGGDGNGAAGSASVFPLLVLLASSGPHKYLGCCFPATLAEGQMSISNWESSPTACFLSWLFKLFKLFTSTLESSIKVPGLVTPGILGRWQGGVWAMGELRRSNRNFRS